MSVLKGVIDFSNYRAHLQVEDDKKFKLSVLIQNAPEKLFTFKTQSMGLPSHMDHTHKLIDKQRRDFTGIRYAMRSKLAHGDSPA